MFSLQLYWVGRWAVAWHQWQSTKQTVVGSCAGMRLWGKEKSQRSRSLNSDCNLMNPLSDDRHSSFLSYNTLDTGRYNPWNPTWHAPKQKCFNQARHNVKVFLWSLSCEEAKTTCTHIIYNTITKGWRRAKKNKKKISQYYPFFTTSYDLYLAWT